MLHIRVELVDEDRGYRFGDDTPYETMYEETGDLFKALMKEYGRCTSKMFVDKLDGSAKQVGWCFEKKAKYEDTNELFTQAAWVWVFTEMPVKTVTIHAKHPF